MDSLPTLVRTFGSDAGEPRVLSLAGCRPNAGRSKMTLYDEQSSQGRRGRTPGSWLHVTSISRHSSCTYRVCNGAHGVLGAAAWQLMHIRCIFSGQINPPKVVAGALLTNFSIGHNHSSTGVSSVSLYSVLHNLVDIGPVLAFRWACGAPHCLPPPPPPNHHMPLPPARYP
jgi:hypothetical protein